MNTVEDIICKRDMLSTIALRFSPQVQPIKEASIDRIIEQILVISKEGLSLQEIQDVLSAGTCAYPITRRDIENSLSRLAGKDRILHKDKKHVLSEETWNELKTMQDQAETRFNSVVDRLFNNAKEGSSAYVTPFLKFLCKIFAELGEQSVRLIKGDISRDEFISSRFFPSALHEIKKEFDSINHTLFESASISFFRDSDPEYDTIKWNMAQNYYIAKALGLDPGGLLLSDEVFGHAIFYLDTNIIIPALEPRQKLNRTVQAFNKACKQLDIILRICKITLNELNNWLIYNRENFKKVIDQIPDETAPYVRSVFYEIYYEKKKSGEAVNIEELFASFNSPEDDLQKLFGVEWEDDSWFQQEETNPKTIGFSENLRSKYSETRARPKMRAAALHDALLLLWIQKLREETGKNIWLITADTSLPGIVPPDSSTKTFAITLDTLLQWISPIAISEGEEDIFTTMFAEMIKYRLLPQDRIFNLRDFLIFHEMHMSCKELPAEDVEGCIRYIKTNAPLLDPAIPSDREKLTYEVSKFFADPGRKYKQELTKLETEKQKTQEELGEANRRIDKLEKKIVEYEQSTQERSLKKSAWTRLSLTIGLCIILEVIICLLADAYGEGKNFFQKVNNAWYFWGILVPFLTLLVGWFLIGKKRLKSLGWPFTKIFKG